MSFIARTHPQQGYREEVDDRGTTWDVFTPLHERFGFSVDVAASDHNAKLPRYYTRADDGLAQPWTGERVWCNPPYSTLRPWVEKAWREWDTGAELITLMLPANRTDQGWWRDLIEPARDAPGSPLITEYLPGRVRFLAQLDTKIKPNARPPFGIVLAIWSHDIRRTYQHPSLTGGLL